MGYLTITGGPCFTAAEAQKLKHRIARTSPAVEVLAIHGVWVYYAQVEGDAAAAEEGLRQLLPLAESNDDDLPASLPASGNSTRTCYVTPRYMSPWSSQATAVAHVCGLTGLVTRVERGRVVTIEFGDSSDNDVLSFRDVLHDRMTETLALDSPGLEAMFAQGKPAALQVVDIFSEAEGKEPLQMLAEHNQRRGLSLDKSEMEYLVERFRQLGRPPSDVELFSFAQVNSEHCRHKQFNAGWTVDGTAKGRTLFEMIRNTHRQMPEHTVSAYGDNAAVLEGVEGFFWGPDYSTGSWRLAGETVHMLAKVETHNHPTAIAPFPGAATGSGGEIRDEGAVGRGSTPKAGLCGFWVSDLLLPDDGRAPWELDVGRPAHFASSLDVMLEAPIGSARYNNEFGRPCLAGCFRTLLVGEKEREYRGYHKPIMIAGGVGTVRPEHALKRGSDVRPGAHVVVLGGPAMLIGLGGGAASSAAAGAAGGSAELDFDSVQRGNPEVERRAQMVINACVGLGAQNPIAFIHDVGAGGLSNALPELVRDAGFGGRFELRQVACADRSMSPLEIWCNEAQERYVLLVNADSMNRFASICRRERCDFSDVGRAVARDDEDGSVSRLVVTDRESAEHPRPIDLPMDVLFPPGRRLERTVSSAKPAFPAFDTLASLRDAFGAAASDAEVLAAAVERVFGMPSVGSKAFLITIGDRTVGGHTVRDQMVGPWQTPVADVAVTGSSFSLDGRQRTGEAMAMGEKPTVALISAAASARMAVAESLLNLGAADIMGGRQRGDLRRVKLSANWMAAVNHGGEGAALYEAVEAIGMGLCPQLEVSIPVGKDSTSMKTTWRDGSGENETSVTAPVSVVISAFSLVEDVRRTWTPQLRRVEDVGDTVLLFVDLALARTAMGGSALAQSLGAVGDDAPDVRDAELLRDYFDALAQLHESGVVLAYHDRSDGGLITTVAEMMFAGRCGVDLMMDDVARSGSLGDMAEALFNEELGAVFQVRAGDEVNFKRCFATCGPPRGLIKKFGAVAPASRPQRLTVRYGSRAPLVSLGRAEMQRWWARTSHEMQRLRDDASCAEAEYETILDDSDPGLSYHLTFAPGDNILPMTATIGGLLGRAPRVAVLREQGVNGAAELAFAFRAAGFDAVDVHMTDVLAGRSLADFVGLAAPGGFSHGDVLGAGRAWAQTVLRHAGARRELRAFFERPDTFAVGICNGCQVLSRVRELIPGAEHWPVFVDNASRQFEARVSMVKVDAQNSNSIFFHGMHGSALPIVVSHGEGRARFSSPNDLPALEAAGAVPLRYVDNRTLKPADRYPANPNGSPGGVAAVSAAAGRVLALMPHPERTVLADRASYVPPGAPERWGTYGPWIRMFRSARRWVG